MPKTLKMVLDTSLLNTHRYVSRIKWSNPEKGIASSPTPRCSSYWKGSLLVALDFGCQLYLLTIYIYIYINRKLSFAKGDNFYCHDFAPFFSQFSRRKTWLEFSTFFYLLVFPGHVGPKGLLLFGRNWAELLRAVLTILIIIASSRSTKFIYLFNLRVRLLGKSFFHHP